MTLYESLTPRQKLLYQIIKSSTALGQMDACKLAKILDQNIIEYANKKTLLVLKRDKE